MKKNSKIKYRDYSKYDEYDDYEYYGIFKINGKTKIDIYRFKKLGLINDDDLNTLKSLKGLNTYFNPQKKHYWEFFVNRIKAQFNYLRKLWFRDYKNVYENIKTPEQIHEDLRVDILNSSSDNEYATEQASISNEYFERLIEFPDVKKSFLAMFYMLLVSRIDRMLIMLFEQNGDNPTNFSYKYFKDKTQEKFNINLETLVSYNFYNKSRLINNFLKHNSSSAYNKLKNKFPDAILNLIEGYKNGDLALNHIKLDTEILENTINELQQFMEKYCMNCLGEDYKITHLDYDKFFYDIAKEKMNSL